MAMTDWHKVFSEAHLNSWPTATLCIQSVKPPHETARNIYKEDRAAILSAAKAAGYEMLGDDSGKAVSFIKHLTSRPFVDGRADTVTDSRHD